MAIFPRLELKSRQTLAAILGGILCIGTLILFFVSELGAVVMGAGAGPVLKLFSFARSPSFTTNKRLALAQLVLTICATVFMNCNCHHTSWFLGEASAFTQLHWPHFLAGAAVFLCALISVCLLYSYWVVTLFLGCGIVLYAAAVTQWLKHVPLLVFLLAFLPTRELRDPWSAADYRAVSTRIVRNLIAYFFVMTVTALLSGNFDAIYDSTIITKHMSKLDEKQCRGGISFVISLFFSAILSIVGLGVAEA